MITIDNFFRIGRSLFMSIKSSLFLFTLLFIFSCSSTQEMTSTPVTTNNYSDTKFGYILVAGMDLEETERGILVVLDETINFKLASHDIEKKYEPSFVVFEKFVNKNTDKITRIFIEGHTDDLGSTALNKRLSQSRSLNGVNKAAESGVSRTLMRNAFVAETMPVYFDENSYKNRRIEFLIMSSQEEVDKYQDFLENTTK